VRSNSGGRLSVEPPIRDGPCRVRSGPRGAWPGAHQPHSARHAQPTSATSSRASPHHKNQKRHQHPQATLPRSVTRVTSIVLRSCCGGAAAGCDSASRVPCCGYRAAPASSPTGMRLINFKLGDASEVASKHDFITAEEYESGASETVPGDRGGGYNLQGLLDTAHYGTDAATEEEDSWQVDADASDTASESSLSGPAFATYCLNCSERRHGDVCETCGHDSAVDPLTVTPAGDYAWCRPGVDRDVAIVYDDRMTLHQKGDSSPHPERPDRLRAIMYRLLSSGLAARCKRIDCREATLEELLCVHSEQLVERNKQISDSVSMAPDNESLRLSSDLYINKHTFQCAKLAAGGSAQVAAAVARKEASAGAAIVRPPGHHAESGNAMGFCFFNNAAVAARVAQRNGAQKVMIVDWDVHHGNGTQNIFLDDPSVLYISLHRYDMGRFYPGTGGATEVGTGQGKGFSVNIPWDYDGMGDDDYVAAFNHVVLPIASEFKPDLTIVSAGFDAAEGDPLGTWACVACCCLQHAPGSSFRVDGGIITGGPIKRRLLLMNRPIDADSTSAGE